MKILIDTQVLYYLRDDSTGPLDSEAAMEQLRAAECIVLPETNLSEIVVSSHLDIPQKLEILDLLIQLKVHIGYQGERASSGLLTRIKIELQGSNVARYLSMTIDRKARFEQQVLIELGESLVGIFVLFLQREEPLAPGLESAHFHRQFTALMHGNHDFTDENIRKLVEDQYSGDGDREFKPAFIQFVYMLIHIALLNFYTSKCNVYLHEVADLAEDDANRLQFQYFIDQSDYYTRIMAILNGSDENTRLLRGAEKKRMAREAMLEYKNYLLSQGYAKAYAENIGIMFEEVFLQGAKLTKNDVIDNHLFTFPDEYTLLSIEKGIRRRLKQADPQRSQQTEELIAKISTSS